MKRGKPLHRKTPLNRGLSRLNPIAKRKQSKARKDAQWRRAFLLDNSWCEIGPVLFNEVRGRAWLMTFPCGILATEPHEIVKRSRGGSITDPDNILATCRDCHQFTEVYPSLATQYGLLAPRSGRG